MKLNRWQLVAVVSPAQPETDIKELHHKLPSYISHLIYNPRQSETIISDIKELQPELMIVYSFQHILSHGILQICPGINLHPSLLPAYPGLNPWLDQMKDQVKTGGYTLHELSQGADSGNILAQTRFQWPETSYNLKTLRDSTLHEYGVPLITHYLSTYHSQS